MAAFDLYIDTNAGEVVTSQTNSAVVPLPTFIQGDTPTLNVWLLEKTSSFPNQPVYSVKNISALSLEVAIGEKIANSTTIYTQQLTFTKDLNNTFFTGTLALNTDAITTVIGANPIYGNAYFEVKYLDGSGFPTTVLEKNITLNAAVLKGVTVTVPPGATALTAEYANAIFLKRLIVGAITIQNPNTGHKMSLYLGDDDTFHADPIS